jgi:hypothetical protein
MSSPFVAHQLCPPYLRSLVEDTVQAFDDSWLLPSVEGGFSSLARLA